jgi:hypothetical protein
MPSSVIGRWISGSSTVASAACTACSTVPAGMFALVDKARCTLRWETRRRLTGRDPLSPSYV